MTGATELDALIDRARGELEVAEPPEGLERVQAFGAWSARQRTIARRVWLVACVASVLWLLDFAYSTWLFSFLHNSGPWRTGLALIFPLAIYSVVAQGARRSAYLWQIGVRALLFATCMVGASTSIFQTATYDSQLGIALGSMVPSLVVPTALLMLALLGGHGLDAPRRGVPRTGFEKVLSLSLVMGLADAAFMMFVASAKVGVVGLGPWPFILPLVLGAGAYGILHGRVWGLLLMALGNLAEVLLIFDEALFGSSLLTGQAAFVLMLTATVQLLLPVPVYAAMLSPSSAWVERLKAMDAPVARVLAVVIGILLALSAWLAMTIAPHMGALADAVS
ncbi:MAG: hypothetical protein ACE37F_29945 [Nannocystaceae bacterium]|nr:hypothetical protein [bacterium]